MKDLFVLVLFFLVSIPGFACLNEFEETIDGHETASFYYLHTYYRSFDTQYSKQFVDYYDLNNRENIDYEELSDVSVHLAKLGRYEESLELLLWLNARHPDEYQICANLGTLYELNGHVDSAYYFIEKSMQINPDSHMGTEWVHLSILKAKKEIAKNSNWLSNHRVLNLGLNKTIDFNSDEYAQVMDTITAIDYQMYERVPFTPVPDPILADIFDELGDILAKHYSVNQAYIAYSISLQYGPENKYGTQEKIKNITALVRNSDEGIPYLEDNFPPANEFAEVFDDLPGQPHPDEYIYGEPVMSVEGNNDTHVLIWISVAAGALLLGLLVFRFTR
jgi:tetratricopeptide (TPR) repeat protein